MDEHNELIAGQVEGEEATPEPTEEQDLAVVDLNSATEEELHRLPGIGTALAARIVSQRDEQGPFKEPSEITSVPGVSEAMYERLASRVTTGPVEAPEDAQEVEARAPVGAPEDVEAEPPAEAPEDTQEVEAQAPVGAPEDVEAEPPAEAPEDAQEVEAQAPVGAPEDANAVEAKAPTEPDAGPLPDIEEELPEMDAEPIPEWEPSLGELVADGYSVFDPELEEFAVDPEETPDDEPLPIEDGVVEVGKKAPRDFEVAPVKVITENKAGWGRLLLVGLLSTLLGAVAALLILYGLNGTLDFQSASSQALRTEAYRLDGELGTLDGRLGQLEVQLRAMQDLAPVVEQAQADIQDLSQDLATAEATLDTVVDELAAAQADLADLDESVSGLEEQMGGVTGDLDTLEVQVTDLDDQIASMDEELQSLSQSAERFGSFLDGLRELLGESDTKVIPTRTPWLTVTPQPEITVIPLATPTPTQ